MNGWWIPMNRAFATVVALSADSGASLSLSPSWQCLGCVWKPEGPCSLCWVPHFLLQCSFARGNCSCCSVRGCFNSCNGKSVQSLLMWSLTWMFPDTLMHVLQTELVLLICLLHLKPCPLLGFPISTHLLKPDTQETSLIPSFSPNFHDTKPDDVYLQNLFPISSLFTLSFLFN